MRDVSLLLSTICMNNRQNKPTFKKEWEKRLSFIT